MLRNKIVLPVFFSPLPILSKNGTKLDSDSAFFHPLGVSITLPLWCLSRCWERLDFLWSESLSFLIEK
ncbi:hypothetical protein Nmel_005368 [Mimus melanotis]